MIYIASYDLNESGEQDYSNIINALGECGEVKHFQKSVFLVKSNLTAPEIRDRVRPYLGNNDSFFVAAIEARHWAGWRTRLQVWISENRDS